MSGVGGDKYDLDWMVTGVREAAQRIYKSGSYAWLPLLPLLQHHRVQPRASSAEHSAEARRRALGEFDQAVRALRQDMATPGR